MARTGHGAGLANGSFGRGSSAWGMQDRTSFGLLSDNPEPGGGIEFPALASQRDMWECTGVPGGETFGFDNQPSADPGSPTPRLDEQALKLRVAVIPRQNGHEAHDLAFGLGGIDTLCLICSRGKLDSFRVHEQSFAILFPRERSRRCKASS